MKRLSISLVILFVISLACSTLKSLPDLMHQTTSPSNDGRSQTPTELFPPNSSCANPLYPLVKGYQWIYQVSSEQQIGTSKIGITVEKIEENRATINSLDLATGVITQSVAECDGTTIKNFPLMTLSMILSDYLDGEINTEYLSGVFSPSYEDFLASNWALTWEGDYIARGVLNVQIEGEQVTITIIDSPIHLKWMTSEGGTPMYEKVIIPAGTFENALKLIREMDVAVSLVTTLGNFQGMMKLMTTHWFLPFTGLLKVRTDSVELTYMGMTFPVTLSSQVELVEFKP